MSVDEKIAKAIEEICTRSQINGDPPADQVREIFAEVGLSIVETNPLDGTRLWDNS